MGNSTARLRAESEHHLPAPHYERDGHMVTLTIHSGGTVENGVYIEDYCGRNTYKYDNVFPENINFKHIKKTAENLYAGKDFSVWLSVGGELKLVRDEKLVRQACDELGAERELHVYVVQNIVDHTPPQIVEDSQDGSLDVSEFSDLDSPYEYNMRADNEQAGEGENEVDDTLHREGARNNVGDVGTENKGKEKVAENANTFMLDAELDDVNVYEIGDDLPSPVESDEEQDKQSFPVFNPENIFKPSFALGMLFSSKQELKLAIQSYAINVKRSIKFFRNDKRRLYAACSSPNCPWLLRGLAVDNECCFRIRELVDEHTCKPRTCVENISSTWLANKYKERFRNDLGRDMNAWRVETISDLKVHVTEHQAIKAKYKAIKLIDGSADKQYELLWSFGEEVKRTNPGSTVVIESDGSSGRNIFDRMYICLHALKEGFIVGCRPVICLDGCWLKGVYGGVLLTACAVDANNSYLPVAYAVVEKENTETWSWFMRLLKDDLRIHDTSKYTLMSDKQKGLIQAEIEEFPGAEYRFCARHLLANFQTAGFRGAALKRLFWKAARCTTVNSFERALDEIHKIDERAANWLREKPPTEWCQAYFREFPRCDILTNNACETFNANILNARKRPILTMFQQLHTYMMSRFLKNREASKNSMKWNGVLCPRIQELFDAYDARIPDYMPIQSDDYNFQVTCIHNPNEQYGVDLKAGVCGCRKWQLSGLPCIHAIVALNMASLEVQQFTKKWYEVETYRNTYMLPVLPLNTPDEWPKTNHLPIIPPFVMKRKPGRPRIERRLEIGEGTSHGKKKMSGQQRVLPGGKKIRRNQSTVKCSRCGESGHNARRCKGHGRGGSVIDKSGYQADAEVMEEENIGQQLPSPTFETVIEEVDAGATILTMQVPNQNRDRAKGKAKRNEARAVPSKHVAKCSLYNAGREHVVIEPATTAHTLLSFMSEMPLTPSQVQGSQSSVNMVFPAPFLPHRMYGSFANLSGPVPAIIKDGKRFMTLSNILKRDSQKTQGQGGQ